MKILVFTNLFTFFYEIEELEEKTLDLNSKLEPKYNKRPNKNL